MMASELPAGSTKRADHDHIASQARPLAPMLLEPVEAARVARRPQQLALFAAR